MPQSVALIGTCCDDAGEPQMPSPLRSSARRATAPQTTKGLQEPKYFSPKLSSLPTENVSPNLLGAKCPITKLPFTEPSGIQSDSLCDGQEVPVAAAGRPKKITRWLSPVLHKLHLNTVNAGKCLNKGSSGDEPSSDKLWQGLSTNKASFKSEEHGMTYNFQSTEADKDPALESLMTSLQHANLRSIISPESFIKLPTVCQQHLLSLLPESDRQLGDDGSFQLCSSALCNEFLSYATLDLQERLAEGEDSEVQQYIRKELAKVPLSADKPRVQDLLHRNIGNMLSASWYKAGTNSAQSFVKDGQQQVHRSQHTQTVSGNYKDLMMILPPCTVRLENCLPKKVVGSGNMRKEIQPLRNGCLQKRSKNLEGNKVARLEKRMHIDKSHAIGGLHIPRKVTYRFAEFKDLRKNLEDIPSRINKMSKTQCKPAEYLTNKALKTAVNGMCKKGSFSKATPSYLVKWQRPAKFCRKRRKIDSCPSVSGNEPKLSVKMTSVKVTLVRLPIQVGSAVTASSNVDMLSNAGAIEGLFNHDKQNTQSKAKLHLKWQKHGRRQCIKVTHNQRNACTSAIHAGAILSKDVSEDGRIVDKERLNEHLTFPKTALELLVCNGTAEKDFDVESQTKCTYSNVEQRVQLCSEPTALATLSENSALTPKQAAESALSPPRWKRNSIDWMCLSATTRKRLFPNCPPLGDEPELPQSSLLPLPHAGLALFMPQGASSARTVAVPAYAVSEKMHLTNAGLSASGTSALVANSCCENIPFHLPSTLPPPLSCLQHSHRASRKNLKGTR